MIAIYRAAWEIHRFLTRHKIPYAIIGGIAVQKWGFPRVTVDVDLTVRAPLEAGSHDFVELVLTKFRPRYFDPFVSARTRQLILISASNGRDIDISFGVPLYENEFLRRAVNFVLERGKVVRVCSAEDLIIHKCVAGRPQDARDVDGVIARQRESLDTKYIRKWLRFFDGLLPEAGALQRFERAWRAEKRAAREARQSYQTRRK